MTLAGVGMVAVFGFLAFRNFRSGRNFWGVVTCIGVLIGMSSLWVDYQRTVDAQESLRQSMGEDLREYQATAGAPSHAAPNSNDPWAKDS